MSHVNNVQGDQTGHFNAATIENYGVNLTVTVNNIPGEKSKISSVLSDVILRNKQFLRTKLVDSKKYFLQRKFSKEGNESITSCELLRNIAKSKTSLVSGSSGSGKSTLAANITVDWAESEDDGSYEVILYLSSLNTTKSLTLHKLLWGEFASRVGKSSMEIYEELLERKGKILFILDGLGNKY